MKTLGHRVSDEHLKAIMKLIDENGKFSHFFKIRFNLKQNIKFLQEMVSILKF